MEMRNKPKYFYRMFIPFILVGTLIVILFNIFTYVHSRQLLNEKLTLQMQENTYQTMNTLEQRFQVLDLTTYTVIPGSLLENVIEESLGFTDYKIYNELHSTLDYVASFGPEQTTVDFISFEGNWAIQNGSLRQLTAPQKEELEKKYASLENESTWIRDDANEELHLVKQIPLQASQHSGVLLIRIPQQSLTNLIYKERESSSPLVITNRDGEVIYKSDDAINWGINEDFISALEGKNGSIDMVVQGSNETIVYAQSTYNGWTYFSEINQAEFDGIMQPTIISTVLMSSVMLVLTVIIGYLGSNYFSKPIRTLQQSLPKGAANTYRDEFESISESVKEVINTNQSLQNVITDQIEQLKTLFIMNLFYGVIEEDEVMDKLEQFTYLSVWKKMNVCIIQTDCLHNTSYKKEDSEILLFAINEIVKEVIDPTECLTPTVIDSKTQATIMLHQEDNLQNNYTKMTDYFERIQQTVKRELGVSISVGISSSFEVITQSKQALKQGKEALNYRLNTGKECIIFHKNIVDITKEKKRSHFPTKIENQLIESLKQGDREQAIESLNQLLAEIFKYNKGPVQFELSIMRLLNDMINLMNLLGIDSFTVDNQKTLYNTISELKTPEEIEMYIKGRVVYPILDTIADRTNEQYKTLSEQVVHIVQNEFNTQITLESIADRLHYNPSYLSTIFKKEFKQSFSEYLALYRHDTAKNWLVETNISVKEISEKLQYNNSQSFIRSFRKLEGTTPGKYREACKGL